MISLLGCWHPYSCSCSSSKYISQRALLECNSILHCFLLQFYLYTFHWCLFSSSFIKPLSQHLSLFTQRTMISNTTLPLLASAMTQHMTLEYLELTSLDPIGRESVELFSIALRKNRILRMQISPIDPNISEVGKISLSIVFSPTHISHVIFWGLGYFGNIPRAH